MGGKNRDADTFVDQLKSEGEKVVANPTPAAASSAAKAKPISDVKMDEYVLILLLKALIKRRRPIFPEYISVWKTKSWYA